MTAEPPHDSADDGTDADTDDDSAQAHAEDPSAASADAGTAVPADGDADREATPNAESKTDSTEESQRDDLAAELARKRPPQPPQEDLDELQQPATELRSATAQVAGADSAAESVDPAPTTAQGDRAAHVSDGEQETGMAGLDELQPVATELRPATAQAADVQSTAPENPDTADLDRDRDCDADSEPADEEDEV